MTTISRKDEPASTPKPLIGVVGPCASGKSTLIAGLTRLGYRTRHIAQEHSHVKDMWQRLTNPDILVFLDATYSVTCQRRKLDWAEADWQEQQRRLSHARANADLYLDTDKLSIDEVLNGIIEFISKRDNKNWNAK
jgi:ABC-type glutathione transport system ATPase component